MSHKKVIAVFGATGNQGGSVINALLQDAEICKHYRFRGVTRDTRKPASQELAAQGVEMVVVSECRGANEWPAIGSPMKCDHIDLQLTTRPT
jgi:nucleoside-diphosphate-sugar epimerase